MNTAWVDSASFREPAGNIFHLDGKVLRTVNPIAVDAFDAALAEQNDLRAEQGLPLLPHPGDVHHRVVERDEIDIEEE